MFLNQMYLLTEINAANWSTRRSAVVPEHFRLIEEVGMSTLSYDNHHNMVGHIKKLFGVICGIVKESISGKQNIKLINARCKELTFFSVLNLRKHSKFQNIGVKSY